MRGQRSKGRRGKEEHWPWTVSFSPDSGSREVAGFLFPPDVHTETQSLIRSHIDRMAHVDSPFHFPSELHIHILSFCDAGALARAARVSSTFLEIVGPFLYTDIVVTGEEQMNKLKRSKVSSPLLKPH